MTAILFHQLGPYHWARLEAAAKLIPVLCVELSRHSSDYAWGSISQAGRFSRETLFPNGDSWSYPSSEVRKRIFCALNQHRPACVFVHGWSDPGALAALEWAIRTATPRVVMSETTSADAPRSALREWIKQRIVHCFHAALVGGKPHAAYIEQLGLQTSRIFTGYDAVDNEHFAAGARSARQAQAAVRERLHLPEAYFIASKRFIQKKNIPFLLEAYARYRSIVKRPWDLVILGDGPLKPSIMDLRSSLKLTDCLHLPGFREYSDLPTYYGLARAFVHASTTEQWGLVVNEAMAAGLPILLSRNCGCADDLLDDGQNGFRFDPNNLEELAACFARFSDGKCDLRAMGAKSEELISCWSTENFARSLSLANDTAVRFNQTMKVPLSSRAVLFSARCAAYLRRKP